MQHRSALATWVRFMRVSTKMAREETQLLRTLGMSTAHFDVLVQTWQREGLTQQELSQRLLVTKGNVCYLVDKLEAEHLLARRREGKTNRLFLTAKGRALLEDTLPAHDRMIETVFVALTDEERRTLRELLKKLDKALL
ncbi:MAG: MarR family transcriptional regulator [Ktedonobacteraceae bacterium]